MAGMRRHCSTRHATSFVVRLKFVLAAFDVARRRAKAWVRRGVRCDACVRVGLVFFGLGDFQSEGDFLGAGLPGGIDGGEQRNDNHDGQDIVDALINIRDVGAEGVAEQDHAPDPEKSADDVEE
jgi:hypothetical protein